LKNLLTRTFLAAILAVATSTAYAIPLTLDVTSSGFSTASGDWSLTGPTSATSSFTTDYHTAFDILQGSYLFEISAFQAGFGTTSWLLNVGGITVGGESHGVFILSAFDDGVRFATATAVPEPGTLGLLGAGLVGLGLLRRRKAS
jgi:hypothetical protein